MMQSNMANTATASSTVIKASSKTFSEVCGSGDVLSKANTVGIQDARLSTVKIMQIIRSTFTGVPLFSFDIPIYILPHCKFSFKFFLLRCNVFCAL